jgi:hypothetical protein
MPSPIIDRTVRDKTRVGTKPVGQADATGAGDYTPGVQFFDGRNVTASAGIYEQQSLPWFEYDPTGHCVYWWPK